MRNGENQNIPLYGTLKPAQTPRNLLKQTRLLSFTSKNTGAGDYQFLLRFIEGLPVVCFLVAGLI